MASSARTTPAGTAVSQRACLRCIAKKRRCDHERPVCGSCGKLKVSCEYPPPQSRRGPVPGLSKRAEWRVQQCENALWYLLNVPGVTAAVKRASAASTNANRTTAPNSGGASNNNNIVGNGHGNGAAAATGNGNGGATGTSTRAGSAEDTDATLPCAPTSTLDREARAEWWSSHRLDTAGDILEFQRACRKLAGESGTDDDEDTALPTEVTPESRPATAAAPVTSSSPAPQPTTPSQIYTPASSSLRNSMGPSLWQLVTAAIPDSDSAGFARELRELRARRERAVTAAGDADMATTTTTTDLPQSPLDREQLERDRERDRELSREQREHEGETETERELRRLRRIESDMDGQMREQNIEQDREAELRRKREQARAEIAIFEAAIAREAEEVRSYELRRMREREEREREAARQRAAAEEGERNNNTAAAEEETERDRFPGLRLPLGMLPNEHLAWTYGAGGMGGVGGAGKRRRLEDMFW